MKTIDGDLDLAEKNWIQINSNKEHPYLRGAGCEWGSGCEFNGEMANRLLNSSDFQCCQSPFSVWEVTEDTRDWRTDAVNYVAILRANQSSLIGALKYMTSENRVLVHNQAYPEKAVV